MVQIQLIFSVVSESLDSIVIQQGEIKLDTASGEYWVSNSNYLKIGNLCTYGNFPPDLNIGLSETPWHCQLS